MLKDFLHSWNCVRDF